MSGEPSCAIIDPSTNSTSEWTIDCGWMTTSICSGRRSNSQRASMISRALFIMVAESIVILGPMVQVGWRRASAIVTCLSCSAVWLRNGPPLAVSTTRCTSSRRPACIAWNTALCSLSTGMIRAPRRWASSVTKGPATTMVSLFARATVLPASTAAQVPRRPALPTIAATTVSISGRLAIVSRASGPMTSSHASGSDDQSCWAAARASAATTQRGRNALGLLEEQIEPRMG